MYGDGWAEEQGLRFCMVAPAPVDRENDIQTRMKTLPSRNFSSNASIKIVKTFDSLTSNVFGTHFVPRSSSSIHQIPASTDQELNLQKSRLFRNETFVSKSILTLFSPVKFEKKIF